MKQGKKVLFGLAALAIVPAFALSGVVLPASADVLKYDGKYYADYGSLEEAQEAASSLNIDIASEGFVLLKNEDDMLPFGSDVKRVSLFGVKSDNIFMAGTGTGSVSASQVPTVMSSLADAGYYVNPTLINFYADDNSDGGISELPVEKYTRAVTDSYKLYNDAALVVFSRKGGENADVSTDIGEKADEGEHINGIKNKHYLELTNNEQELLKHIEANFDKVVVLINATNPMELKELEDDPKIGGVIWIGQPGENGIMALGKILNGEVNPSGRLVDFYERDFTSSPVWNNYGTGAQAINNDGTPVYNEETNAYPNVYRSSEAFTLEYTDPNKADQNLSVKEGEYFGGTPNGNTPGTGYTEVQYEESIYMGYRFYETMWYELEQAEEGKGDEWYEENALYPYGYGLSYTTFTQKITGVYSDEGCKTELVHSFTGDEKTIYVKVEVKNTGSVAGKEVVQIYNNAPWTEGGIEKSYIQLVGFGKTSLLAPGKTENVVVKINVQDMASFDYNDANNNEHSTYELDAGDYHLFAMADSHEVLDDYKLTLAADKILENDDYSGNKVEAMFSQQDEYNSLDYDGEGFEEENLKMTLVTRASMKDGTYKQPEAASIEELTRSKDWLTQNKLRDTYLAADDYDEEKGGYSKQPWLVDSIPDNWTQVAATKDGLNETLLRDMVGIELYDENTDSGFTKEWDDFMNQLSWEEIMAIITYGSHGTAAVPSIGKPQTGETDGPISLNGTFGWCTAPVQAATFNVELIEQLGIITANLGMYKARGGDTITAGWYGPAMNTHRSHFLGRTFEYYSEDGIHAGYIAAAVVRGAQSRGLNCWIKHFALNDQEIYRKGINTYATEQAMREIYFKPFQMAIQEGGATAIMTSFNRIGQIAAAVNYRLINDLTRGEWGFDGVIVTDMYNSNCWPTAMMLRAGNDLPLGNKATIYDGTWDATLRSGKGGVKVPDKGATPGGRADAMIESEDQYYYGRVCATRTLYVEANIMANRNGVDLDAFADKTIEVSQGVAANESVAIDLGKSHASSLSYELTEGTLPEGLTFTNGTISGTATGLAGTYEFTVLLRADTWIQKTAKITLKVNPAFTLTAAGGTPGAGEAGKAFLAYVSSDTVSVDQGFKSVTFSVEDGVLPEGLELDAETGEISGTPTFGGTYTLRIRAEAVKEVSSGRNTTTQITNYYTDITLNIAGDPAPEADLPYIGENGNWFVNGKDTGVSARGPQGEKGDTGAQGPKGETGEQGPAGKDGTNGADGASGGCGGVIGVGSAIVAAITVLGGAVLVLRKKND